MMADVNTVENFFGCYLLFCTNPKYKGLTYIGFTNNPNRRIRQHNKGKKAGGAYRTSGRGPWEMILIIHGFPNEISALRFEWAWQHPQKSRRLQKISGVKKKATEKKYEHLFRVACMMLRTGPWCRFPLTIRWVEQEYQLDFPTGLHPPSHMCIAYGLVQSKKVVAIDTFEKRIDKDKDTCEQQFCSVCQQAMKEPEQIISCLLPNCTSRSHMICLAKYFLGNNDGTRKFLIPIDGYCPVCKAAILWGDLIKHKKGCYKHLRDNDEGKGSCDTTDIHWAECLSQV